MIKEPAGALRGMAVGPTSVSFWTTPTAIPLLLKGDLDVATPARDSRSVLQCTDLPRVLPATSEAVFPADVASPCLRICATIAVVVACP